MSLCIYAYSCCCSWCCVCVSGYVYLDRVNAQLRCVRIRMRRLTQALTAHDQRQHASHRLRLALEILAQLRHCLGGLAWRGVRGKSYYSHLKAHHRCHCCVKGKSHPPGKQPSLAQEDDHCTACPQDHLQAQFEDFLLGKATNLLSPFCARRICSRGS